MFDTIREILDSYGVRYTEKGTKVFAEDVFYINGQKRSQWFEVTSWRLSVLITWLEASAG